MSAWILLLCGAALADDPLFVGLPLDAPVTLGLGAPTLSRTLDEVRLPLEGGGFVILSVAPTVDEAERVFEGRERTAANLWPPAAQGLPGDRAVGDGTAIVLVRARNAVVLVRDPAERSAEVARRVLAALVTDPAACAPVLREEADPDGTVVRWDRCGRRAR